MTADLGKVCEHGQLKRQCPHCEADADEREYLTKIADQAARIAAPAGELIKEANELIERLEYGVYGVEPTKVGNALRAILDRLVEDGARQGGAQ